MIFFLQNGFAQAPQADFSSDVSSGCTPLIVRFLNLSTNNPTSYLWDLGNGITSSVRNPVTTYSIPGTYTVKLTSTNASGSNTVTKVSYITIHSLPVVNFMASDTVGCAPFTTNFSDQSNAVSGNISTWQWNFGDGGISSAANPTYTYSNPGTYGVFLKVTNNFGCSTTGFKAQYINVGEPFTADFNYNVPIYCKLPVNVGFTSQISTTDSVKYQWDFGDGTTSSLANPFHNYVNNGTYTVKLIVTSLFGCIKTVSKSILLTQPAASITVPDFLCVGTSGTFALQSSPVPSSVLWTMGDGNTYSNPVINHTYLVANVYDVKVVVDYGTCKDSIITKIPVNNSTVTNFFTNDTAYCKVPFNVSFNDLSVSAVQWLWDFGDGTTSNAQNPIHTYLAAGNYSVNLTTTNSDGCSSSRQKNQLIKISSNAITINNLPDAGCNPYTFKPVYTVNAPDGIASFFWDFGNGFTSTLPQPTGIYSAQGNYNFTAILTTNNGCRDTIVKTSGIRIGNKVSVDFSVNPSLAVCASQPIQFIPLLSIPGLTYLWDFGDNSFSTLSNPLHLYRDTGSYDVKLTVDNNGCKSDTTKFKVAKVVGPIAFFKIAKDCNIKGKFTFTNLSKNYASSLWDFGDGNTSNVDSPTHIYTTTGSFIIRLIAINGVCQDTFSIPIQTWVDTLGISATSTTICRPGIITYTLNHPVPSVIQSYNWNFGTGYFVATNSRNWNYPNSGNFSVNAFIIDTFGCRDSVRIPVIRVNGPLAEFGVNNPVECSGQNISFFDRSTNDGLNNIIEWKFDFGDGIQQSFVAPPISHVYSNAGTYNVKLVLTDQSGCKDSIVKSAVITIEKATAAFNSLDTITCNNKDVKFRNLSTGNITGYKWEFGDGSTSVVKEPVHQYSVSGIYTVKLVVYTSAGCNDSMTLVNYVNVDLPRAKFFASDTLVACPPIQVNFTDSSHYVSSWNWQFGNGISSFSQNPISAYFYPGVYSVQLVVTSPGGCKDTAYKNIKILGPTGGIFFSPSTGCNPLTVNFVATETAGAISSSWDFGDGNVITTADTTITYTYITPGKYSPVLLLKDNAGCIIPYYTADTIFVEQVISGFGADRNIICEGDLVAFTDSTTSVGVFTRTWYFGDGTTSNLQNPVHLYLNPGFYTVKLVVESPYGCKDSTSKLNYIRVAKYPVGKIVADSLVCPGIIPFSVQLNADTSAIISYNWNFGNGKTSNLANPFILFDVVGIYNVTLTVLNSSGCSFTTSKSIEVKPFPVINITSDTVICRGSSLPLTVSGGATYLWLPPSSATLSCTTCSNPMATPISDTKYKVQATTAFGCIAFDSVTLKVFQPYTLTANSSYSICEGGFVQLSSGVAPNYIWTPATGLSAVNIPNPVAKPDTTTLYTITGFDSLGCFNQSHQVLVTVNKNPTVELGPDINTFAGNVQTFFPVYSSDIVRYNWLPGTFLSCNNCPNPVLNARENVTYKVIVTSSAGCIGVDTVRVIVTCAGSTIFIPNTFSPNGDGVNDVFYPRGKGVYSIRSFRVFNRWGELIFSKSNVTNNDPSVGWDGTHNGKKSGMGVYTYQMEIVCKSDEIFNFSGSIQLIQ